MDFIVQKYGGTSLGKPERILNVANIVEDSLKNHRIIVVLSAVSSYIKAEGTTSRLIEAARVALEKGDFFKIIDHIEENHISIVKEIMKGNFQEQTIELIQNEIKFLKSFLDAISVIQELSVRSHDVVISTGEKLSAIIFSNLLNSRGIDSQYIDLESIVDKPFEEANKDFYTHVKGRLKDSVDKCGYKIPVLTGYFGFVPKGIINSVGRGYTDLTAALTAVTVKAEELQIWKEVDGVFSADPRKVEDAFVLPKITPEEAAELTYYGSEVIHPFTMEHVIQANIPIRIKNTLNPVGNGTIINPFSKNEHHEKPGTAVTVKRNITVININSNRMLMAYGFMAQVFNILAKHGIIIDLIATSEVNISMTIENTDDLLKAIPELEELGDVFIKENMAILSLVGRGQKNSVGLAGKMFSVLGDNDINIEMISQGASEINISCIIDDQNADKAIKAVHQALVK